MICSFYDREFKGLQDNASLVIDNNSYSLVRRGVELDELSCACEPFTESIQPTFLVVKNDRGKYVYGCLAGIPELTSDNKTKITGTDIKSMLRSDVLLDFGTQTTVDGLLTYVFGAWNTQVNQSSFTCELEFKEYTPSPFPIALTDLTHSGQSGLYNAWDDIFAPYLKYYGLYMTTRIDLVAKKVVFTVGKAMLTDLSVKLWEHGIRNYGKWIASVNECQGYVLNTTTGDYTAGYQWILTSQNAVTTNTALRDIYPIKRKIVLKETDDASKVTELRNEANQEALKQLCDSLFKENIELTNINADFETRFNVVVRRGEEVYKSLPCGEIRYNAHGIKSVQVGYRFTGLQFLI
jgi:hypothetical protein